MTNKVEKKPEEKKPELITWSNAIDILERHIMYDDFISKSSLIKALDRIKNG